MSKIEDLKTDQNVQPIIKHFEYIDKLKEKNIIYKIPDKQESKIYELKNIAAAPHVFKLHDNNPNLNLFIVMSNEIISWYDFADTIGCLNYMFRMLNYSTKQSLEKYTSDEIKNEHMIITSLSMGCSIQ